MRTAFTVLAASLCLLVSCNINGEEPLEEGVMTPDEFFEEIEVADVVDLEDGWWELYCEHYQKDNNGNYKEAIFYGAPIYNYYYYMQEGKITSAKKYAQWNRDGDAWEDVALNEPVEITINKKERTFSFVAPGWTITDNSLRKCSSNVILTIDFNSERQENGNTYYIGETFRNIGEELPEAEPKKGPSYYDKYGNPVYETL